MSHPARAAIIGCGMAAEEYAITLASSSAVVVTACADIVGGTARAFAARHQIPRACAVAELLSPLSTDIAVILTPPASHASIAHAAIRAGVPAVYAEKPLAASPDAAYALTAAASQAGVLLGAAPDTVLGAPAQAARAMIAAGQLGDIVGASASYLSPGPERWHHRPAGFYAAGAGPLADMGPYYLAALAYLLGGFAEVTGAVATTRPARVIAAGPHAGEGFEAVAPTHVTGVLRTVAGVPVSLTASFDAAGTRGAHLEIYGREATMVLPDPNFHDGDVLVRRVGKREWDRLPAAAPAITPVGRGMGVIELAEALAGNRRVRACAGEAAAHVTAVIDAVYQAARSVGPVAIEQRPQGLPKVSRGTS